MLIKTSEQLVKEFITEEIVVKGCPDNLYKVLALIEQIKQSGNRLAYVKLKQHCDIVDENLFSSIMKVFLKGIDIKKRSSSRSSRDINWWCIGRWVKNYSY